MTLSPSHSQPEPIDDIPRATTKRTSTDGKTATTTLATIDDTDTNTDSAQALALQIISGGENRGAEGGSEDQHALVPAKGALRGHAPPQSSGPPSSIPLTLVGMRRRLIAERENIVDAFCQG